MTAKHLLPAITFLCLVPLALCTGCVRKSVAAAAPSSTAFGSALVESSGGKQIGAAGAVLPQPWVVQVNDDQGNGVTGANVSFSGPAGVSFDPSGGVTDSSGQLSTLVTLGGMAGRYHHVEDAEES